MNSRALAGRGIAAPPRLGPGGDDAWLAKRADDEVQRFASLGAFAVEANDFNVGVELVLRAMLQHPEFIYRVEIGRAVAGRPGVSQLTGFELATRLSYFLWGSTPPEWLLDQAAAGELATTEQIRAAALRLLGDGQARARIERFHALWLGYHQLPHPLALTQSMQAESRALVERVVFDAPGDYFRLFTSEATWLDEALATHYGLPWAGGTTPQWVQYGSAPRKGLLSHGSVLSAGAKFADTSPTQRGIFVRNRLFCQGVPPPPPGVNADAPPEGTGSPCKVDRYSEHASNGNCAGCHRTIDPIGFGLERFNRAGQYRTTDDGAPACAIAGDGLVSGLPQGDVAFNGPGGLADALLDSQRFEACVVTQVYRFAMGRREVPEDARVLELLTDGFKAKDRAFTQLLVDLVVDPTFAYRTEEEVSP